MTRTLDIGLDIDGVLYPFVDVVARYAEGILGRPCSAKAESWDWYVHQWGLSEREFFALCGRGVHENVVFTEGAPLPGALEAVRELARAGHRLHYVTARAITGVPAPLAWRRTAAWLAAWDFPVDSLTIAADKACRFTDVFLDDSPGNCDALVDAGHPRPVLWCHGPITAHRAERVFDWDEFLALVDAESAAPAVCPATVRSVRRPARLAATA
ncbi:5' nucleotidase, NT5C type [Streptomyces pristinaespiralis]|uniref:5' nucleotidase, NT5C type n=1 Tax=Streptomyces pristinaespiralis TaxID=38300 RepID=UPI003400C2C0